MNYFCSYSEYAKILFEFVEIGASFIFVIKTFHAEY